MNVLEMPGKVLFIANPVIAKSSLPNFSTSILKPKCVRESALDELDISFQRDVIGKGSTTVQFCEGHERTRRAQTPVSQTERSTTLV